MTARPARLALVRPAAGLALLGVLIAVAILLEAGTRADQDEARAAAEAAARAVLPVTQEIADQVAGAALAADPDSRTVGPDDADGPSAGVAAQARDTGEPALDDSGGGQVVTARYDGAVPASVAARRAALTGYTLTPLRLDATLAEVVTAEGGLQSLAVSGPDLRVASAGTSGGARFAVGLGDAAAPGWTLTATGGTGTLPVTAWLAAVAAVLLGLIAGLAVARRTGRSLRLQDEATRRARYDVALAELASVAQSSLDLAEVLPTSSALLEDALDLDGLALVGSATRTTFVWRDAPTEDEPALPAIAPVPAGACVELPLARSGRSLGALRIRPARDLDELDLTALATAAETISSSIANAEAFAHQRALVARMRKLDDLKTVFVATASHELRTPVAAVIGYANMLTEGWHSVDSDTGLLYAQRVESNAQRLVALVENLLDFSRLEQGGSAQMSAKEPLDLGLEVRNLIETQPALAPHHDLRVIVTEGLVVAGSRLAIERVVGNLVGNAAKYSPAGTTIRVRVERTADGARLAVDDEGPGVPAEEREQIFSRFFRGAGDAVTRTQGAGLGLAIVSEFAAFMGGTVSLGPAPSGGTRFEVNYPLHEPRPPVAVPVPQQGDAHVPA